MKIEKIEIKNYRSLSDVTICPKDILTLVGRNNSGKSNIIKALDFFFNGRGCLTIQSSRIFFNKL
ncbi:MAG: AAA family ATPase [Actinobacteria bacterium]|nr:AAA family ATPase [Actinomycetota bacterium]MBE3128552.1 AAA family ATPase [Actinomycetota bacterium]